VRLLSGKTKYIKSVTDMLNLEERGCSQYADDVKSQRHIELFHAEVRRGRGDDMRFLFIVDSVFRLSVEVAMAGFDLDHDESPLTFGDDVNVAMAAMPVAFAYMVAVHDEVSGRNILAEVTEIIV